MRLLREPFFPPSNNSDVRLREGFTFEETKRRFFLHAEAHDPNIGFAQVSDGDILIFAVSTLVAEYNGPGNHTAKTLTATITFSPYDLLAAIRREVKGGKPLRDLEDGLKRLKNTRVRLVTGGVDTYRTFPLLEDYSRGRRTAGVPHPLWSLTVPPWILEEVGQPAKPRVAWFNPDNFGLDSLKKMKVTQFERLIARWAVGYRGYQAGKPVAIRLLHAHALSGMDKNRQDKFLKALDGVVKLGRLPDHTLKFDNLDREDGGDLVIDLRPDKERPPIPWRTREPESPQPVKRKAGTDRTDGMPGDITGDAGD